MSQNQTSRTNPNGPDSTMQPEPEVVPQAKRRTFSAAYKLRILEEADRCQERGQIGALLRRESLYYSHLGKWRRQREVGNLQALAPKKRGSRAKQDARDTEIAALRRENEHLQKKLEQAELIIAAQKKLAQVLEQTLGANEDERS